MCLMTLEQLIHDEGRKEKRERALKRELDDSEHGEGEQQELKYQEILADPLKEKLFGELLRIMYPTEGDALFERLAGANADMEDLKKINAVRYELQGRMTRVEKMRTGLEDGDIQSLAERNEDFDAIAGILKDDKRTAEVIRDHFYLLSIRGDTDTLNKIAEAQRALIEMKASPEFARANRESKILIEKHGFSVKDYSILEKGYTTSKEREEFEQQSRATYKQGSIRGVLDWVFHGSGLSPSEMAGRKRARVGEKSVRKLVREHSREKMNPLTHFFDTKLSRGAISERDIANVMRRLRKIDSNAMATTKEQYGIIAEIIAASVSANQQLLSALQKEALSQGTIKAEGIDRTEPISYAKFEQEKNLTEATFKAGLKSYLKERVKGGLDAATLADPGVRTSELERYQQQATAPKQGVFGFFVELLRGFRRAWLTADKRSSFVGDNNLWQTA